MSSGNVTTPDIWSYILQFGYTKEQYNMLEPDLKPLVMLAARRRMGDELSGTYSAEFRCTTTSVNPSIGDKILRHTFRRRRRHIVSPEHFVVEATSCLTDLMNDSRYSGRVFTNFVFFFITDENSRFPVSISASDIKRLRIDGCIKELLKMVKREKHDLYQSGSGEDIMNYVEDCDINTRFFTVTSKSTPVDTTKNSRVRNTGELYMDECDLEEAIARKDSIRNASSGPNSGNPTSVKYVGFDFETVIHEEHGNAVPYAFSVMVYDKENPDKPEKKFTFVDPDPDRVKEEFAVVLDKIKPSHKDENVYLIGFNNSNFDNFLLHEIVIENNITHSQPFIVNSSILGFVVDNMVVRDLRRFVMTSLDQACKDFKLADHEKKLKLEHWEIQLEYYNGQEEFGEYLHRRRKKIRKYVERDVSATMNLFFKCQTAYTNTTGLEMAEYHTLASVAMAMFKQSLPDGVWDDRPRLGKEDEEFVRQATYGGRSQVFNLKTHIKQALAQGDVKSLYPHLMKLGLYPLGQSIKTDKYIKGKIGVYRVKILKQPKIKIVANRVDGGLNWDDGGKFHATVTNVTLECLDEHGGEYKVLHGVYWEESASIFGDYVDKLYKIKAKQDKYKDREKNQPEKYKGDKKKFNASLRNIVKLLLNALSGKMVQKTYHTIVRVLETKQQLREFREKTLEDTECIVHNGSTLYASAELKEKYIKRNIPVIWGILIYEYSRRYMYDNVYSKFPIFATETDSYTTLMKYAIAHRDEYPHMYGNKLGQIELEYVTKKIKEQVWGIFVAKKVMCLYKPHLWEAFKREDYRDEKWKKKFFPENSVEDQAKWNDRELVKNALKAVMVKSTFKGVNMKGDKVVTEEGYELLSNMEEKFRFYWDDDCGEKITVDTYDKLARGETIYVMCSQLRRRLRTDNVNIHIAHIAQIFMLKEFPRKIKKKSEPAEQPDDPNSDSEDGLIHGVPIVADRTRSTKRISDESDSLTSDTDESDDQKVVHEKRRRKPILEDDAFDDQPNDDLAAREHERYEKQEERQSRYRIVDNSDDEPVSDDDYTVKLHERLERTVVDNGYVTDGEVSADNDDHVVRRFKKYHRPLYGDDDSDDDESVDDNKESEWLARKYGLS